MVKLFEKKDTSDKGGFKSILDTLKSNIMNVSSTDASNDIDASLERISGSVIDKDVTNYAEIMKNQFSDVLQNKFSFKDMNRDFFQTFVQSDRYIRYANSEEIVDCIPYCARALKVISDEIVAPDELDKTIVQVIQEESESEGAKQEADNVKKINKILEVEDHIHSLVYETLKLGDQFVEICDYTSGDVPITQSILTEDDNEENSKLPLLEDVEIKWESQTISESTGVLEENKHSINIKPSVVVETDLKNTQADITNVRLIIHDPRYVIKLQSNRFKMCLGYILLPRFQFGNSTTNFQGNHVNSALHGMSDYKDMNGIDRLYSQIMTTVKKHIGNDDINVDKKEVLSMMSRCVKEFEEDKIMEFKVRYVSSDKMEHFSLSTRRFFPYGESIFYKTTFAAKLLIALETATTVKRITDSTDTRVFYIETGIPRNARDVIDEVREARTKKKVSIDKMGSIGSIPCLSLDTKIRLTAGYSLSLKEIIHQFEKGELLEVYSYDHESGKVRPDKIKNAKITGYNVNVIKVTLDNDKYVICTPDHLWMLRNGSYIEAKDLKPNDSLMSFYRKSTIYDNAINNHKVKSVEILDDVITVGDIETEHFHNFEVEDSVFIHNSMINSYEDYYIPQVNGKRFLEFDTIPPAMSIRDVTEELKYFRDILVASLEVPPSYIGLEENLCLSFQTLIRLIDGRSITLKDLIHEYNDGKELEVYSYDHESGMVVPGKVTWAGYTKLNTKCVRVWLDNNEYIDCTPDHPFMLRDGTYKEAQYLTKNESLMPLYTKDSYWGTSKGRYECIYHPGIDVWNETYKSFAYYLDISSPGSGYHIHHINMNSNDNRSCNLVNLTPEEHMSIHSRIKKFTTEQLNELIENRTKLNKLKIPGRTIVYDNRKCIICDKEFYALKEINRTTCSLECRSERKKISGYTSWKQREKKLRKTHPRVKLICPYCGIEFERHKWYVNQIKGTPTCGRDDCYKQGCSLSQSLRYQKQVGLNHKVSRVEFLEGTYDTGDITIENYHNFGTDAGVFVHNSNKASLSFENILFARTIVSYQAVLSKHLKRLFSKLHQFIFQEKLNPEINIQFSPPRMLQVERESEHMRMIGDLITTLSDLGINKDFLIKKYLPFDWKKLDEFETEAKLDDEIEPPDEDEMGGGVQSF